MQPAVAEAAAQATRHQAVNDAHRDLQELRRQAVEAGRDRSRKITKTSRIDPRSGEIRYNPAGRLLRDWYLHAYLNTLRSNLGEPAVPIDAQQVEDTTAILRRLRPRIAGVQALRAVAILRGTAVDDAAHAAADIVDHLATVAARRAILHAPDDRFDGDQLAIHVTRHWYQRCYDDHIHGATHARRPLTDVTDAEQHQVALVLATGQARRLIGPGGIPLISVHGTTVTRTERNVAAGGVGLVSPIGSDEHHLDTVQNPQKQVRAVWSDLTQAARTQWLAIAGVSGSATGDRRWSSLDSHTQGEILRFYLASNVPEQLALPFEGEPIGGEPRQAAMAMFGHAAALDGPKITSPAPDSPLDRAQAADHQSARPARTMGSAGQL